MNLNRKSKIENRKSARQWILYSAVGVIGLAGLAGCDVFQIHPTTPGPSSSVIGDEGGAGTDVGATGTGVGTQSAQGPHSELTGTSTQRLGTGFGGAVSKPGPERAGR